ncbi:MAG: hypothetical protein ACLQG3_06805 [Terracidiphilus sp.]
MPIPQLALRFSFILAIAAILLSSATPARAASKGDVSFGYSRTGNDTFYSNAGSLNGWELDGQVRWKRFIGIEGDVARYGMGADAAVPRTTAVLFGPKLSLGTAGYKVFGHFLVGGEHSANGSSSTPVSGGALGYVLGGGVEGPIAPFFAWRVQVDRIAAINQSPSDGTHARFSTGLVFRF